MSVGRALATEWKRIGGFGRATVIGLLLAAAAAVFSVFAVERAVRSDLLSARADILSSVVDELRPQLWALTGSEDPDAFDDLDQAVRQRLLGGETLRVKVWTTDSRIAYSDVPALVGEHFDLGADAREAFDGQPSVGIATLNGPENIFERDLGELLEFYLPVADDRGVVSAVFEIYQRTSGLDESLAQIRTDVRRSIGAALLFLTVSVTGLMFVDARALDRRRQQAERLADSLMHARAQERQRIVGALHDDIGQPLYRILFGIRGSRERTDDQVLDDELQRLEELVTSVDESLRSELRLLHSTSAQEIGLGSAVAELVATANVETDLAITLTGSLPDDLSSQAEAALYRAVHEALFNIRKHARASLVEVGLAASTDIAVAEIEDDGIGWDGVEGIGLATTRMGLDAIGGGLRIQRRPAGGTLVRAWVPRVRRQ